VRQTSPCQACILCIADGILLINIAQESYSAAPSAGCTGAAHAEEELAARASPLESSAGAANSSFDIKRTTLIT
jgi:hypothetical protein